MNNTPEIARTHPALSAAQAGSCAAVIVVALAAPVAAFEPTPHLAEPAELSFQLGAVIFQNDVIGSEAYLRYRPGRDSGPFRLVAGFSYSSLGDSWLGFGAEYRHQFADGRTYIAASVMPGAHFRGRGPDLGGLGQIRSGLEVGTSLASGGRLAVGIDHRSNANLGRSGVNPGMESAFISFTLPLR